MKITFPFFKLFMLCFIALLISTIQGFSQEKTKSVDLSYFEKQRNDLRDLKIGTKLPILVADGINGDVFNSEQTKRIVFYYFWYTDCGNACTNQLPLFNELQNQYKNTVDFISITYDSKAKIEDFLQSQPFNFKHYIMPQSEIAITQITNGYPTTIIVIDGIIKYWNSGGPVDSKLINELSKQYIEILNQGK